MKKTIVAFSLLAALFTCAGLTHAESTCFCLGPNRAPGTCGSGGAFLGTFMDTKSYLLDDMVQYYLPTPAAIAEFNSKGRAYDMVSGWACWRQ